jgi:hypothetical protein
MQARGRETIYQRSISVSVSGFVKGRGGSKVKAGAQPHDEMEDSREWNRGGVCF